MKKNFLENIKLAQNISLRIPISISELRNILTNVIAEDQIMSFKDLLNKNKLFFGQLNENRFILRHKSKLFSSNLSYLTYLKGEIKSNNNESVIDGQVAVSKTNIILIPCVLILVFGVIFVFAFNFWSDLTPLIYITLYGLFLIALIYFVLRLNILISKKRFETLLLELTNEKFGLRDNI